MHMIIKMSLLTRLLLLQKKIAVRNLVLMLLNVSVNQQKERQSIGSSNASWKPLKWYEQQWKQCLQEHTIRWNSTVRYRFSKFWNVTLLDVYCLSWKTLYNYFYQHFCIFLLLISLLITVHSPKKVCERFRFFFLSDLTNHLLNQWQFVECFKKIHFFYKMI